MATSEPMSDARLAEIRAMLDEIESARALLHSHAPEFREHPERAPTLQAGHDLLAEVERLHDVVSRMLDLDDIYAERHRAELAAAQATIAQLTVERDAWIAHFRSIETVAHGVDEENARLRPVVEAVAKAKASTDELWGFEDGEPERLVTQARAALEGEAGQ